MSKMAWRVMIFLPFIIGPISAAVFGRFLSDSPDPDDGLDLVSELAGRSPISIQEVANWPEDETLFDSLGQVPGMAVCPISGKLNIFARRDIVWDGSSFDEMNRYQKIDQGPIGNDTVIIVEPSSGTKIKSWGSKMFYMPHGITIDSNGSVWVTDVAMHQVFKFSEGNHDKPSMVIGEKFVPGKDQSHFCKPTDVAVSSTGYAYISDGYCNSRLVILDPTGKVVGTFDIAKDGVDVPHSVTLLEQDDLVCVADREFRRIPCYTAGMSGVPAGTLVFDIRHPKLGRVFAIDHLDDIIFAVNGPDGEVDHPLGLALDLASHSILTSFSPAAGFYNPHDVCVSRKDSSLFVSEIDPRSSKKVYKFSINYA